MDRVLRHKNPLHNFTRYSLVFMLQVYYSSLYVQVSPVTSYIQFFPVKVLNPHICHISHSSAVPFIPYFFLWTTPNDSLWGYWTIRYLPHPPSTSSSTYCRHHMPPNARPTFRYGALITFPSKTLTFFFAGEKQTKDSKVESRRHSRKTARLNFTTTISDRELSDTRGLFLRWAINHNLRFGSVGPGTACTYLAGVGGRPTLLVPLEITYF